jgi:hypothetical protein
MMASSTLIDTGMVDPGIVNILGCLDTKVGLSYARNVQQLAQTVER